MRILHRLALATLLVSATATAQQTSGAAAIPENACYDVTHYRLEIGVDPEERSIDGELTMTAKVTEATSRIALDLDEALKVAEVMVDGKTSAFEHRDLRIWIPLEEEREPGDDLVVRVRYGGEPRVSPNPPWKGGFTWSKTRDGKPWIATSCQGEGADLWWPCKDRPDDEPASFDLIVTVPAGLVCAANGVLQQRSTENGRARFHWHVKNPISNYCIALNIGPYEVLTDRYTCSDGTVMPVEFYVLPQNKDKAAKFLPQFLDHVRHMESRCGPYPFRNEKYGVVETPHLGMEHQTIIAYGNRYRPGPFDYDWLHHHEMCHEWWANLVTCADWKDMWIHEGIGTYMQALYIEEKFGPESLKVEMETKRRMLANKGPVAPREHRDSQSIYFAGSGNDIYYKGSWICHSLRWLLGDETFFQVLRRWAYPTPEMEEALDGSQCRFSDTEEIRAIAERESGVELGWFFEVYLRQPKLPTLLVKEKDGVVTLRWELPEGLSFPMPVPMQVGNERRRIEMADGTAEVRVGAGKWEVDPDRQLLMQVTGVRGR